jgi:hypothetical protein
MAVLARLRGDVVAEPVRLLIGIGTASDADEQSGVIDDRAILVVEANEISQAERDHALTEHVFHGLAKAQVHPK